MRTATASVRGGTANRRPRARIIDRIALRLSASKTIEGLWVGVWEDKPERYLSRVEEALGLIKAHDRIRYDRLRRDLKRVWVLLLPGPLGSFRESLQACQLDSRFVIAETSSPLVIASVIVHEATHARLRRCGIGYQPHLRARVEAVCFRRERAFAAKLPLGERIRDDAERALVGYAGNDFWTDAEFEKRHVEGSMEALRHLGMPDWLGRAAVALRALYVRMRRRAP